jgi:spermidine/putrescine transport system substrate-binding protein
MRLFTKLRQGNPGYDVIYPSGEYVERIVRADLLLPLDVTKIPNMANVDPALADPKFDPGLKHSMAISGARSALAIARARAARRSWRMSSKPTPMLAGSRF